MAPVDQSNKRSKGNDAVSQGRQRPRTSIPAKKTTKKSNNKPRHLPQLPPPPSLVKLLQADQAVLAYFQRLNDNLDVDRKVWKEEAATYKKENERLRSQLQKADQNPKAAAAAPRKKKPLPPLPLPTQTEPLEEPVDDSMFAFGSSSDDEDDEPDKVHNAKKDTNKAETPIADSMFQFGSSSDDDDGDDDNVPVFQTAKERKTASTASVASIAEHRYSQDAPDIFPLLKEAFEILAELGISLVLETGSDTPVTSTDDPVANIANRTNESAWNDIGTANAETAATEMVATDTDADDHDASEDPLNQTTDRVLKPRLNEDVLVDLLKVVRTLTRMQLDELGQLVTDSDHLPFVGSDLIPSCNVAEAAEEEPSYAAKGKTMVFRLLVILDNFCSPKIFDAEWKSYFNVSGSKDDNDFDWQAARCGLRGRKVLVDLFVSQLEHDICGAWATADRSSRMTSTVLHYISDSNSNDDIQGVDKDDTSATKNLAVGTKSQIHLSTLVERCLLAQTLLCLYHSRNESKAVVRLTLNYTISVIPALCSEDDPKLPPTLSLVVLESLLNPDARLLWWETRSPDDTSFPPKLRATFGGSVDFLLHSLACCVHTTAAIFQKRLQSQDERIQAISRVELASYHRMLRSESSWMGESENMHDGEAARILAHSLADQALQSLIQMDEVGTSGVDSCTLAFEITLVLYGDSNYLKTSLDSALKRRMELSTSDVSFPLVARACCRVIRQFESRRLEVYQQRIGSTIEKRPNLLVFGSTWIQRCLRELTVGIKWKDHLQMASTIMKCAVHLADGKSALEAIQHLVQQECSEYSTGMSSERIGLLDAIRTIGWTPLVRVINLERRSDRMDAFMSQALQQGLLVVKAVIELESMNGSKIESCQDMAADGFHFGLYAIDGRGRLAEVQERLEQRVGSPAMLNALVATHWRPHDLKPFDKDAPDKDDLVRSSPSERACALSHVASWKGIMRSLRLAQDTLNDGSGQAKFFNHPSHLLRLFQVSGFAEGPALLAKNVNLPPAPVCVILEDDAILADDFAKKLQVLLKELPRDFHYCALGYGRPKTAPIVSFSGTLGIPTCQWYLTGYVLSLAGTEYLQKKLPVVGPVDSWIGLMLTSNWDNVFGNAIGLGVHASSVIQNGYTVATKDLSRIMQFRAFCALQPLCWQKVGGRKDKAPGKVGRSWRQQRDTDIVYSGDGSGLTG